MSTPKRGTSIERENPFRPGSDIQKAADSILRSSTISGDRITIVDPSSPQYRKTNGVLEAADEAELDSEYDNQCDSNEQVLVSINTHDINDNNDNVKEDKPIPTTDSNGCAADEPDKAEKVDNFNTKKKKKDKAKKTCQII